MNEVPYLEEIKRLNRHALGNGVTAFTQQVVVGAMYYATGRLVFHYPQYEGVDIWIALFAILFAGTIVG